MQGLAGGEAYRYSCNSVKWPATGETYCAKIIFSDSRGSTAGREYSSQEDEKKVIRRKHVLAPEGRDQRGVGGQRWQSTFPGILTLYLCYHFYGPGRFQKSRDLERHAADIPAAEEPRGMSGKPLLGKEEMARRMPEEVVGRRQGRRGQPEGTIWRLPWKGCSREALVYKRTRRDGCVRVLNSARRYVVV